MQMCRGDAGWLRLHPDVIEYLPDIGTVRDEGDDAHLPATERAHPPRSLAHISFTLRQSGTLTRVISARDLHRKERAIYDQAS